MEQKVEDELWEEDYTGKGEAAGNKRVKWRRDTRPDSRIKAEA